MSQRLTKQNSIPSGELEEAEEEELVAVKRQPVKPSVDLESDDELKFEDQPEDADNPEAQRPRSNSRENIGGNYSRKKTNQNHVTFDDQCDDEMTAERKSKDLGPDNFEQKMEDFDDETLERIEETEENECDESENVDQSEDSENVVDLDDKKESDAEKHVECYERSALQYDNHLFINKYRIELTPPITTDILEQEFYLDNEDRYKARDYSSMFRYNYPKTRKPQKFTKSFHISTNEDQKDDSFEKPIYEDEDPKIKDTDLKVDYSDPKSNDFASEPFSLPDFPPWYPFSFYSFQRYLDTWEIEREIFDRQIDFIKRKPGRYISPLRIQRATTLSKSPPPRPFRPRSPISSFRPQWKSPIGSCPDTKRADLDVPKPAAQESSYKFGDIEMRLHRLNEKAKSLDNHIKHLKYMWHS